MAGTEIGEPCGRTFRVKGAPGSLTCPGVIEQLGEFGDAMVLVACQECGWVASTPPPDIPQDSIPGLEL